MNHKKVLRLYREEKLPVSRGRRKKYVAVARVPQHGAILASDPDHSSVEERFLLIGLSVVLRVLVVVHGESDPGGAIRLISARRATRSERGQYAARWK